MPAKYICHAAVVDALHADGWTVTHDPLSLKVGDRDLFIDLGAGRPLIGAQRGEERIAVEIQSFLGASAIADLQQALGQYVLYRLALEEQQPDRRLYLAVPPEVYNGILAEPLGQLVQDGVKLRIMLFEPDLRQVLRWIN